METIDLKDTLTLMIASPHGKTKGEISINIYDLYYNSKKKYALGEDTTITLKVKYVETGAEDDDETYDII